MESLLIALFGFIVLVVGTAVVFGVIVALRARRRWHAVRDHAATRSAMAAGSVAIAAARGRRRPAVAAPEELARWSAARTRREMWRAVDSAQAAVRAGVSMGAPVGDLPALCGRLQRNAETLDSILRHEVDSNPSATVRAQVAEVLLASNTVQRAGVLASGEALSPEIATLVADAENEVQCVTAGLASMRAASGPTAG